MSYVILKLVHTNKSNVTSNYHRKVPVNFDSPARIRIECADKLDMLVHSEVILDVSKDFKKIYNPPEKGSPFLYNQRDTPFHHVFPAVGLLYFGKAITWEKGSSDEKLLHSLDDVLESMCIRKNRFHVEVIKRVHEGHKDLEEFRDLNLRWSTREDKEVHEKSLLQFANELGGELPGVTAPSHASPVLADMHPPIPEALDSNIENQGSKKGKILTLANPIAWPSLSFRNENCYCDVENCEEQLFTFTELVEHMKTKHSDL